MIAKVIQLDTTCFLTGYDLLSRLCCRTPRICAHRPLWTSKFCASLTSKFCTPLASQFCSLLEYSSNLLSWPLDWISVELLITQTVWEKVVARRFRMSIYISIVISCSGEVVIEYVILQSTDHVECKKGFHKWMNKWINRNLRPFKLLLIDYDCKYNIDYI